jgi:hypothetical protein
MNRFVHLLVLTAKLDDLELCVRYGTLARHGPSRDVLWYPRQPT